MRDYFDALLAELARILQVPSFWEVFSALILPLGIAAVSVYLVLQQIRQLDRHRGEDRRAAAVAELTDLLIEQANMAVTSVTDGSEVLQQRRNVNEVTYTAVDQYRTNRYYVKAITLLDIHDRVVAKWAQHKAHSFIKIAGALIQEHGFPDSNEMGPVRSGVMNDCSWALDNLLQWVEGELPTAWFEADLARIKSEYPM